MPIPGYHVVQEGTKCGVLERTKGMRRGLMAAAVFGFVSWVQEKDLAHAPLVL